ncbi:MAG: Gfo/Idh/MocA family oxidoreductase [Thaumarchaeota archaeon]|nr:Gfo/Idh/MocA family oxidoreductase [Nitrososphaerota archaeon]
MGKRRVRNLLSLGYQDIVGFDIRKDRRNEASSKYGIETVSSLKDALARNPEAMIISTPPDLHAKYANIAIDNEIHFFTEVNLFSAEIRKILNRLKGKKIVGSPSCTMLYHPVVKELKKIIDRKKMGKILTVYHHYGHYLPNWHPWEDYRDFYVSKRKTGAAREIVPFELIWLTKLFSEVKSVYGDIAKVSNLKADIDDVYQIFIEFRNGIKCILVIDVFSRPPFSETKIIGEKGAILCEYNNPLIKIGKEKTWKTIKLKMDKVAKGYKGNIISDSIYEHEIYNFLNAIKNGNKLSFSFMDELKILEILDAIETSGRNHRQFTVKPN